MLVAFNMEESPLWPPFLLGAKTRAGSTFAQKFQDTNDALCLLREFATSSHSLADALDKSTYTPTLVASRTFRPVAHPVAVEVEYDKKHITRQSHEAWVVDVLQHPFQYRRELLFRTARKRCSQCRAVTESCEEGEDFLVGELIRTTSR